ncbi:hypothetical protein [Nonomuraea sp. NPDC002799]
MPERGLARSLVEAYVYFDLRTSEPGASSRATVAQEADGWVVSLDGAEVFVPREAESWAREGDVLFGGGLSELIDPGQWVLVATTYASRALEGALFFAEDPSDPDTFERISADWRFAADAVAEALKFFPPDYAELPSDVFWSEMGRVVRESDPGRVTRVKLENDLALYRQSLDDFRRLHTR